MRKLIYSREKVGKKIHIKGIPGIFNGEGREKIHESGRRGRDLWKWGSDGRAWCQRDKSQQNSGNLKLIPDERGLVSVAWTLEGRKPVDGGRRKTPSAWELGVEGVGEIVGLGDAGFDVHLAPRTEAGGLLEGAGNASRLGCLKWKHIISLSSYQCSLGCLMIWL